MLIQVSICDIDFFNFQDRQVRKFKISKLSEQNWNSAVIFKIPKSKNESQHSTLQMNISEQKWMILLRKFHGIL